MKVSEIRKINIYNNKLKKNFLLFYIKIISLVNYCRVFIPKYNKRISLYIYLTENLKTHSPGSQVRVKNNDSSLF